VQSRGRATGTFPDIAMASSRAGGLAQKLVRFGNKTVQSSQGQFKNRPIRVYVARAPDEGSLNFFLALALQL
jgi:hypothetical protein